jgi:GUN4-like
MVNQSSDYNHLNDLLAAQQWKEADDETARIMLKIAGREAEGWLDCESIMQFPCVDLNEIDRLWLEHSNNRFGISLWETAWSHFGSRVDNQMENRLGELFGWYDQGVGWKFGERLDFSLNAPIGHLPNLFSAKRGILERWLGCTEVMHSALAWKFSHCLSPDREEPIAGIIQPQTNVKYEQSGTSLNIYFS